MLNEMVWCTHYRVEVGMQNINLTKKIIFLSSFFQKFLYLTAFIKRRQNFGGGTYHYNDIQGRHFYQIVFI